MTETENQTDGGQKRRCPLCACVNASVTRRVVARLTDYIVWGMLSVTALFLLLRHTYETQNETLGAFFNMPFSLFIFMYAMFVAYVFVEASLICLFKTTLGKWLAGLTVTDENGEKLTYKASLRRAWTVFFKGMWLFLPYISLIAPLFWLYRYCRVKSFAWDDSSRVQTGNFPIAFKIVLLIFYATIAYGMISTYRQAASFPDLPDENAFLQSYSMALEPYGKNIFDADKLNSMEQIDSSLADLQKGFEITKAFQDKYLQEQDEFMQKVAKISDPKAQQMFTAAIEAQKRRVMMFSMLQQIRLSLQTKIMEFFKESFGKYKIVDGEPVFDSPELQERFLSYVEQTEEFYQALEKLKTGDFGDEADDEPAMDEDFTEYDDDISAEIIENERAEQERAGQTE